MKLYFLRHEKTIPNDMAAVTKGPIITMREDAKGDDRLLAHEAFHAHQWWACLAACVGLGLLLPLQLTVGMGLFGLFAHGALYAAVKPYRKWSEVFAYRIQINGHPDPDFPRRAAVALATGYGLGIDENEARRLLRIKASKA